MPNDVHTLSISSENDLGGKPNHAPNAEKTVTFKDDVTYFIGHESIVAGKAPGMNPLLERLFVLLNRGADSASRFFNLPTERVFEVGSQVEI